MNRDNPSNPEEVTEALRRKAATGEELDLRVRNDNEDDAANSNQWGPSRQLAAGAIAELATDAASVHHRGLRIRGVHITGHLDLVAATIPVPVEFTACGFDHPLQLHDAEMRRLSLTGCVVPALHATGIQVAGTVNLNGRFRAQDEVFLSDARIGKQLNCTEGHFETDHGHALTADRAHVDGNVVLRHTSATGSAGAVRLAGARIGGDLDCTAATLAKKTQGDKSAQAASAERQRVEPVHDGALNADSVRVEGNAFLRNGFRGDGGVLLRGAKIGGQLSCRQGAFINENGYALLAERAQIQGVLDLNLAPADPLSVKINLAFARAGVLHLRPVSSPMSRVRLTGFSYEAIYPEPAVRPSDGGDDVPPIVTARTRIRWLAQMDSPYAPGKYNELAGAYRRSGYEKEAEQVVVAKLRARRKTLPWYLQFLDLLGDWTVKYGYQKSRAVFLLFGLVVVGCVVFHLAHPTHLIATEPAGQLPDFQPFVYALDVVVPIIDLRQQTFWVPDGGWAAAWTWVSIALGWALTTTAVVGMTGLLTRRD